MYKTWENQIIKARCDGHRLQKCFPRLKQRPRKRKYCLRVQRTLGMRFDESAAISQTFGRRKPTRKANVVPTKCL